MPEDWEWDETLYRGSAPYYVRGRLPYAPGFTTLLASGLELNGRDRLLDVGCGPGIVTLPLAHCFVEAVGVDPDPEMLTIAAQRARVSGIGNVRWVQARGEDLPAGLGRFRVATFAQAFHWMDRPRVSAIVFDMLEPGGAFVYISDVKEPRPLDPRDLPHPQPPTSEMHELLHHYLGPERRAGQGVFRHGTPGNDADALTTAGFEGPTHLRAPAGGPLDRSVDDLVAWMYSLSSSAPHLFGNRFDDFDAELRRLLDRASPSGLFSEQPSNTEAFVWRKPLR